MTNIWVHPTGQYAKNHRAGDERRHTLEFIWMNEWIVYSTT